VKRRNLALLAVEVIALDVGFKTHRPSMNVPRHALTKIYEIVAIEV
jgi:hypothetical protein